MRLDWYSASIVDDRWAGHYMGKAFADFLGSELEAVVREGKPFNGYETCWEVCDSSSEPVLKVLHGGINSWVFLHGGSDNAPLARDFLDSYAVDHLVSRVDVAIDFFGDHAFNRLTELLKDLALRRGLKVSTVGDWLLGKDGRTLYLGSRSSEACFRIYEKGKERLAKNDIEHADPRWVRCELELKPKKERRRQLSTVSIEGMWGWSAWTQEVYELLTGCGVERIEVDTNSFSSLDRALAYLVRQYGNSLERFKDREGWSWGQVGEWLGQCVEAGADDPQKIFRQKFKFSGLLSIQKVLSK